MEQSNHYYPYGATTYESIDSVAQPYKYNGKELERTADVDWYDYGARFYDPVLARFTTMDPLCEKYYGISPYAYCTNNPVNMIDIRCRRHQTVVASHFNGWGERWLGGRRAVGTRPQSR